MKRIVFLFFVIICFVYASAQISFTTRTDSLGNIKYVRFSKSGTKDQLSDSKEFFKTVLKKNVDDIFNRITLKCDSFTHERFQQYYKGVKVEHGVFALHYKDNLIISANGQYLRVNPLDVNPRITEKEAIEFYAKRCGLTQYIILKKPELIICKGNDNSEDEPLLAYKVFLSSDSVPIKETGYINAIDTSGWKTGTYAVMATIEGKTVSKKIIIR